MGHSYYLGKKIENKAEVMMILIMVIKVCYAAMANVENKVRIKMKNLKQLPSRLKLVSKHLFANKKKFIIGQLKQK